MEFMLMPLKRYADFSGRSRRKEFWMFYLFTILCFLALMLVSTIFALISESLGGIVLMIGYIGIAFGFLVPQIACGVRRLHDQDKSGWLMLLMFVPIANIVLLVFMFLEGTRGPNQYGPDPKDENNAQDIFN